MSDGKARTIAAKKDRLRDLFKQQEQIDHDLAILAKQVAEIEDKRRLVDEQIDAALVEAAEPAAQFAADLVRSKPKLLDVVASYPDESLGQWALRLYHEDTPKRRHLLRNRLYHEEEQGRVRRDGGKWVVLAQSAPSASVQDENRQGGLPLGT